MPTIVVNGEAQVTEDPITVAGLVRSLGLEAQHVAVERNRDIVPRDAWAETPLADGDQLEVVTFVGGG